MDARLQAPGTVLRPVRSTDLDLLYVLLVQDAGSRGRYRGATPPPAEFHADLWRGVHVQYVVCDGGARPVGLVGLANTDPVAGHSSLFAFAEPGAGPSVLRAAGLLVDWAFAELELNKVWVDTTEYNLEQYRSLQRHAAVEARLVDHEYWRGRFWDRVVLSIARSTWERDLAPVVAAWRRAPGVDGRLGGPEPPARGDLVAVLGPLLEELWPLDSLGVVELLAAAEEQLGRAVPDGVLDGLGAEDPAVYLDALLARLEAPPARERYPLTPSVAGRLCPARCHAPPGPGGW